MPLFLTESLPATRDGGQRFAGAALYAGLRVGATNACLAAPRVATVA
jgi:hypothetical protein